MLAGSVGGFYSDDDSFGVGSNFRWGIHVRPSLSYFFRDRIAVGASASFGYRKGDQLLGVTEKDGGLSVHMVFDLPLAERLSFLLWPSLGYHWAAREQRNVLSFGNTVYDFSTNQSLRFAQAGLFLPLLFHATPSLGFGFGPHLHVDFAMHRERSQAPLPGEGEVGLTTFDPRPTYRITTGLMSTILGSF